MEFVKLKKVKMYSGHHFLRNVGRRKQIKMGRIWIYCTKIPRE